MVVEDIYEDPRFSTKGQEFEERGVRSYMGATLVSSTGPVIGTVCIYAEHPRTFSQEDKNYLRRVAVIAMDLIEAHSGVKEQADLPAPEGPVDKEGVK